MDIDLDQGDIADAAEAMDLPGLDDKNVTGAGLELFSIHGPETPALPYELYFIVRMTMGPGTVPRKGYRLSQNARRRSLKPAASPQNAACDVFAINWTWA
jgi:hypothetical protein